MAFRPRLLALVWLLMLLTAQLAAQEQQRRGVGPSGLPLPRFASLASGEVNVRTGPSTDHPIRWVYERQGLPVRIVEEHDAWRRIEDPDGGEGWAHSSLLSTRRMVMLRGPDVQALHRTAGSNSRVVARAESGVLAELLDCTETWCRIEAKGQRGWVPRESLWGLLPVDTSQ